MAKWPEASSLETFHPWTHPCPTWSFSSVHLGGGCIKHEGRCSLSTLLTRSCTPSVFFSHNHTPHNYNNPGLLAVNQPLWMENEEAELLLFVWIDHKDLLWSGNCPVKSCKAHWAIFFFCFSRTKDKDCNIFCSLIWLYHISCQNKRVPPENWDTLLLFNQVETLTMPEITVSFQGIALSNWLTQTILLCGPFFCLCVIRLVLQHANWKISLWLADSEAF